MVICNRQKGIKEMANLQEISCKLCLKIITDTSFQIIGNVIKQILDVLLLELKFNSERKEVICNACKSKLYTALAFKSVCLHTDNTIIPHVHCDKMLQLDLRELYIKVKAGTQLEDITYNHRVCRLCMQLVKSEFRHIQEDELNAIQKLMPEMNITVIKDPVVCKSCFDSLWTHNSFLNNCREKRIENIWDTSATDIKVEFSAPDLVSQTDILCKEEYIDIKLENEEYSDVAQINSNEETIKTIVDQEPRNDTRELEYILKDETKFENYKCYLEARQQINPKLYQFLQRKETVLQVKMHKCDDCDYRTICKSHFEVHRMRHKHGLDANIRYMCAYENIKKKFLFQHQPVHKLKTKLMDKLEQNRNSVVPSEVRTYKCDSCIYVAENEMDIERHLLEHTVPSQARMYKCVACNFEARDETSFDFHQLQHKSSWNVKMSNHDYELDHNYCRQLMKPLKVHTYKCDACTFHTVYESSLRYHMLKHKVPSEIQMYKCPLCSFETRYKRSLKCHTSRHKINDKQNSRSKPQMYKCYECAYQTNSEVELKAHKLSHSYREKQVHKCDKCSYSSKELGQLLNHLLKHDGPLEMCLFKCEMCDVETSHRSCRLRQQCWEEQANQCNVCGFVTSVVLKKNAGNAKIQPCVPAIKLS